MLIGRNFWPHGNMDSARYLFRLACALHRGGMHIEVVTPRFASSWPEHLVVREIPVHRPAAAPRSDWSINRYVRHLTTWLRSQAASFDVIMVDSMREESMAAIEAARSIGCPVVVRCSRWGDQCDTHWWTTSRSARRCASIAKMADAVIAKSAVCQRALLAEGFKANQIQRIDDGFDSAHADGTLARAEARLALAKVNSDLATAADTPVVLCASPMTRHGGVNLLVSAARHLVAKYPDLRFWFVGDGPYRDWIYESLRSDGLRASIAMPGSFCDLSDLFAAADVFLQPDDYGLESILPSAVEAELPIVAVDTESTRAVLTGQTDRKVSEAARLAGENIHWCSEPTPKQIRIGLTSALADLAAAKSAATELRRQLLRSRPHSDTVSNYVQLIKRVVGQNGNRKSSSIKAVS